MCQKLLNKPNANLPIRSQVWLQPCAFLCLLVPLCSPRQRRGASTLQSCGTRKSHGWVPPARSGLWKVGHTARLQLKARAKGELVHKAHLQGVRRKGKTDQLQSSRYRRSRRPMAGGLGFQPAARQACVQALA